MYIYIYIYMYIYIYIYREDQGAKTRRDAAHRATRGTRAGFARRVREMRQGSLRPISELRLWASEGLTPA